MYKTAYVCDCCGKEMEIPGYTLELRTNSFSFYKQDRISWHYCEDCWEDVKKVLTEKNELDNLEKVVKELKEENEKLKREASWYQEFWLAMFKAAQKNREKYADISPYMPNTNNPFTECCCESADKKEDLDYKQTVGMI